MIYRSLPSVKVIIPESSLLEKPAKSPFHKGGFRGISSPAISVVR
jgi:hypothetical protein